MKNQWNGIFSIFALTFALFTACDNSSSACENDSAHGNFISQNFDYIIKHPIIEISDTGAVNRAQLFNFSPF